MPFDNKGKHHLSTQKAMAGSKMPNVHKQSGEGAKGVGDPMPKGGDESDMAGDSTRTIISHNDDGTHSVMHHDGEAGEPKDSLEEALEEIRMKHGGGMTDGDDKGMMAHHMPPHAMMSGM